MNAKLAHAHSLVKESRGDYDALVQVPAMPDQASLEWLRALARAEDIVPIGFR
jgi:hypothetical protein